MPERQLVDRGLGFYDGGNYPASYFGALFFADYSRDCIWAMRAGPSGLPDPNDVITFVSAAANPVDVEIGPGGDLFYADFDGGTIRRVRYLGANQAPVANATATPTSGQAPLNVALQRKRLERPRRRLAHLRLGPRRRRHSSTTRRRRRRRDTYTTAGTYNVRLRVTDSRRRDGRRRRPGAGQHGGGAGRRRSCSPAAGTTWAVGDTDLLLGLGHRRGGRHAARLRALTGRLILHHCPSNCHSHPIQDFVGTAAGSFVAPDHEYPSHLELRLTATDSAGQSVTTSGSSTRGQST